jgi:hypothetical protein
MPAKRLFFNTPFGKVTIDITVKSVVDGNSSPDFLAEQNITQTATPFCVFDFSQQAYPSFSDTKATVTHNPRFFPSPNE